MKRLYTTLIASLLTLVFAASCSPAKKEGGLEGAVAGQEEPVSLNVVPGTEKAKEQPASLDVVTGTEEAKEQQQLVVDVLKDITSTEGVKEQKPLDTIVAPENISRKPLFCDDYQGDNPIIKALDKIDCEPFEETKKYEKNKDGRKWDLVWGMIEAAYKNIDVCLAKKDLPGFMEAYKGAKTFHQHLEKATIIVTGDLKVHDLKANLETGIYGRLYKILTLNPEILSDLPINAEGDPKTEEAIGELNYFLAQYIKQGQSWGARKLVYIHDDETLAKARNGDFPSAVTENGEFSGYPDGTYGIVAHRHHANVFSLMLTNTRREGTASYSRNECDFIDLGSDGIDQIDARLSGIPDNVVSLRAANTKARDCMAKITGKLKQRYAGMDYFTK